MAKLGNVGATGLMAGEVVSHFSHGHFNPLRSLQRRRGPMPRTERGRLSDSILNNKLGLAFLSAASKLKPGSPNMVQLIHVYGRRLANGSLYRWAIGGGFISRSVRRLSISCPLYSI